jgi:hypothetical protein
VDDGLGTPDELVVTRVAAAAPEDTAGALTVRREISASILWDQSRRDSSCRRYECTHRNYDKGFMALMTPSALVNLEMRPHSAFTTRS